MVLFEKLYRPSLANNKALLDKLDKLDIRQYPGENVTLFVQDAVKIVRELQMNFMSDDAMPELTLTALTGLSHSSDPGLKQAVRELRLASDVNGFGFTASAVARPDALSALLVGHVCHAYVSCTHSVPLLILFILLQLNCSRQ
jgi:hypothetical protein